MSAALLSRFDLVFILLDRPDEEHDKKLSEHIMRTHALAAEPPAAGPASSQRGPGRGWEGSGGGRSVTEAVACLSFAQTPLNQNRFLTGKCFWRRSLA